MTDNQISRPANQLEAWEQWLGWVGAKWFSKSTLIDVQAHSSSVPIAVRRGK